MVGAGPAARRRRGRPTSSPALPAKRPAARERRRISIDGQPVRDRGRLAEAAALIWLTPEMDRLFVEGAVGPAALPRPPGVGRRSGACHAGSPPTSAPCSSAPRCCARQPPMPSGWARWRRRWRSTASPSPPRASRLRRSCRDRRSWPPAAFQARSSASAAGRRLARRWAGAGRRGSPARRTGARCRGRMPRAAAPPSARIVPTSASCTLAHRPAGARLARPASRRCC